MYKKRASLWTYMDRSTQTPSEVVWDATGLCILYRTRKTNLSCPTIGSHVITTNAKAL